MAPQRSTVSKEPRPGTCGQSHVIKDPKARVTKREPKPRAPMRKRRNGLLNTTIPARSTLMDIAKRNAVESPLLSLPGEIRNNIWEYVTGGNSIAVSFTHRHVGGQYKYVLISTIRPLQNESDPPLSGPCVRPNFSLPRVCRQIYTETALLPYSLNTFTFDYDIGPWYKTLTPAQKKAVTSIQPSSYFLCQYTWGGRVDIRKKFPNIRHIRASNYCWTASTLKVEEVMATVRKREGPDVVVD